MSEYRGIYGAAVKSQSSNTGTIKGQIWYDTSTAAFKLEAVTTADAWASGGNLNASKSDGGGGGPQTAALYWL